MASYYPTKALIFSLLTLTILSIILFYYTDSNSYSYPYRVILTSTAIFLTVCAGIVSGLTIGLMSLDETTLRILLASGSPQEQSFAARILPIKANTYLLLCTLLAANAVVSESLPIVIDRIVGEGWKAILSSTIILLLFGELIPQAYFSRYFCSNCCRYGLVAGAKLAGLVRIMTIILYPLVYPLSFALQSLIGKNTRQNSLQFRRNELKALVNLLLNTQLTFEEVNILTSVLELIGKARSGYSRIPLYSNGDYSQIDGILLTRRLLNVPIGTPLRSLSIPLGSLLVTSAECGLFELLKLMREGRRKIPSLYNIEGHMALLVDKQQSACGPKGNNNIQKGSIIGKKTHLSLGIITIEDVLEALINQDIYDEGDLGIC